MKNVYIFEVRLSMTFGKAMKNDHITWSLFGTPSGARTLDTLIKSQVLYQLS